MSVFNSLGSNYKAGFVFKSLLSLSNKTAKETLSQKLSDHFGGEATLTYKGRDALELAVKRSGLAAGGKVGINGFTCYVVYKAVVRAGLTPVFIDVAKDQLNFDSQTIAAANKNEDLKAIIVQNTLGVMAPVQQIEDYCKQKGILIIEDLAHSLGGIYSNGKEAGTLGTLTMLSFSQDKPLDVVAGGALVNRLATDIENQKLPMANVWQRFINRSYPFWSFTIRKTYSLGIGRLLHAGLKKLHLMATPMGLERDGNYDMSPKTAALLLQRWEMMETEFNHRRIISEIYRKALPENIQFDQLKGSKPVYLRFPIRVKNRQALIDFLKQNKIYISDTWYDAPIGPKRYLSQTNYKSGDCPNSEQLSEVIVNLPTHINVSENQAKIIAEKVNQWLK